MPYFIGAKPTLDDDGNREYTERGLVWVRDGGVIGFYDHCLILSQGHKIIVMEDFEAIRKRLRVPLMKPFRTEKKANETKTEDGPAPDLGKMREGIDRITDARKEEAGRILADAMDAAAAVDRQLDGGE